MKDDNELCSGVFSLVFLERFGGYYFSAHEALGFRPSSIANLSETVFQEFSLISSFPV